MTISTLRIFQNVVFVKLAHENAADFYIDERAKKVAISKSENAILKKIRLILLI